MDYKLLANKLFEKGKGKMEDLEVFIERSKEIEISVFGGDIADESLVAADCRDIEQADTFDCRAIFCLKVMSEELVKTANH